MAVKQDLVVTQKRLVTKIQFNGEATGITFGITGSAFDNYGGFTGDSLVRGITNNTAALSRILWTASANGYSLQWNTTGGAAGMTAMSLYGSDGEHNFEKQTLRNNDPAPFGTFRITPTGTVTGTVILEFVHNHNSTSLGTYLQ